MKKKSISLLIAVAMATTTLTPATTAFAAETSTVASSATEAKVVTEAPASIYGVKYDTHIQKRGWGTSVKTVVGDSKDNADTIGGTGISGTMGKALRVEAVKIEGTNLPEGASIEYEVHQQTFGWSKPATNGAEAGVTGKGKRAEAIKVTLKGMPGYAVKYQAYVQKKAWMDPVTTENGTAIDDAKIAGTTGEALRIEAIRVQIVKTDAEKAAEVKAINAVAAAEAAKDQASVDAAKAAIADVQDTNEKAGLTEKVNAIVIEQEKPVEETKVSADSINAVSDTKVSVAVTEGQDKTADKLKDSKVTLTDKDGKELTASFATLSEDGKTADYTLSGDDKLVDAATYTASSEAFDFKEASFMARVANDTYIKEVSPLTTGLVEAGNMDVYLQAKNQYGEDMDFKDKTDNIKVSGTVNGVPLLDTEIVMTNIAKGEVTINKLLKENDKVQLSVTNKIADADVEIGNVSYTVGKAEAQVATTITGVTAKYSAAQNGHEVDAVAKEVMPDDEVELTPEVKDQFKNPMAGQRVRWVIESGKDLITKTDGDPIVAMQDGTTLAFKAAKTGTLKIAAYLPNGEKTTYEVTIGAKTLATLTEAAQAGTKYNQDENVIYKISGNDGAVLTPDMIKFDVKAGSDDVTAADVQVSAKYRGGDNEATKNDIVIVAKSSKAGSYKITPYVGESLEKATVKADEFTYATTIDQNVTSIEDIKFSATELKVGKTVTKDLVFKNKHDEVVVPDSIDIHVTPTPADVASFAVTGDAKGRKLEVTGVDKGSCQLTVNVGRVFKSYTLNFAAPTLTTIEGGANISGTVAGDESTKAKYQAVKFYDQDNETMNVKSGDLKVTVSNSKGENVTASDLITLGKTYSVAENGDVTFDAALLDTDNLAAIKVLPAATLAEGTYTVTIASKTNAKLKDTFTVSVGAKRAVKTVDVKADSTSIALGGATVLRITPKDQYGDLVKVGTDKIAVTTDKLTKGAIEEDKDKDENVIGYKVTLTGASKGTENVKVDVNVDGDIAATNKAAISVDSVGNLVNSVAIDNSSVKALYSTEADDCNVQLAAIAKDSSDKVVPVAASDLTWNVVSQKDAEGKDTAVTATIDANGKLTVPQTTAGSVKVSVTTSNEKEGTIELNFSKDAAAAKAGTTALTNAVAEKVVDADTTKDGIQVFLDGEGDKDGEAAGVLNFNVNAKDQYGEDFAVTTGVTAKIDDTSVASVDVTNNKVTITAKGVGTANVYVTYNGDKIKLEVSVSQAAVTAAGAAADAAAIASAKEALNNKIAAVATAEEGKVEGPVAGNQISGSKATLDAAKGVAQGVYDDSSATLAEVQSATTTLNNAITAYTNATVASLSLTAPSDLSEASGNTSAITGYELLEGETLTSTSATEGVATVDGLNVTAVTAGSSEITVQILVNGAVVKTGTVEVTVNA